MIQPNPDPLAGLWEHQRTEIEQHAFDAARGRWFEPRTGKTRTCVFEMQRLAASGVLRFLVIAPIRALEMTWEPELSDFFRTVNAYTGATSLRLERIAGLRKDEPTVLLVNPDVLYSLKDAIRKWSPQYVCADESHFYKNAGAKRTRALWSIGDHAGYRRALSGTPTPKSYADLYSVYRFLDKNVFGSRKADFMSRYIVTHPKWPSKVVGYNNLPELEERVFSIASRVTREQCFDMPREQVVERVLQFPKKARDMYDKLVTEEILREDGVSVDATHKVSKLLRLQQLTAGFLPSEDGELVWVHDTKIEAIVTDLAEIIECGQRAVVSYKYAAEGKAIEAAIRKAYGPIVQRIGGDTPGSLRGRASTFDPTKPDDYPGLRVLVVQEQLGIGVSYARADHLLVSSQGLKYDDHKQMRDRIWKPQGHLTFTYYRIHKSVDSFAKRIYNSKASAERELMDVGFAKAAWGDE